MSEDYGLFGCTFEEDVRSEPVPKGEYRGKVAEIKCVDPVLEGWEARTPEDDMGPRITAAFQIEALADGSETELKGRYLRRVKLDLRPGTNPKTGEPYRKVVADLIRAYNGLGAKGSVKGYTFFPPVPAGLSRADANARVNEVLAQYTGMAITFSVRNYKGQDGQMRDALGGIIIE